MIHAVTLSDFVRRFTDSRSLAPEYAATLRRRAAALERFAGEQAIGVVLVESHVNNFLRSLAHLSAWTVRGYRTDIIGVWYAAADDGLVPYPVSRRIRRERLPDLLVDCYTVEEGRALRDYAETLCGVYPNGVAKKAYWTAAISLAWDAGFRRGDCWRFRRDAVRPDGALRIIQHKTKQVATVRLRESTLAALDAIGLPMPLEWTLTASRFSRHFKRIVKGSGVNRGTFKFLRRSSGSYVEAQQPGAGHKHLGNGAQVFARFYDAKLGEHNLPMPPEL